MAGATISAASVASALAVVRARIEQAGGQPDRMTIVAVTKGHGPGAVVAARAAGLYDIGENYATEMLAKSQALGGTALTTAGAAPGTPAAGPLPSRWHFIGAIQRNKVKSLAPLVSLWQTVDRMEEADALARASVRSGSLARVLIEVCLVPGAGRGGCPPDDLEALLEAVGGKVEVIGLMGVGPAGPPEAARPGFRWLRSAASRLGLAEVSMGMSHDLEVAVQEGSTMVRVGTALFGPRSGAPGLGR
ncbi:MAG: YggS family pyridoxal phosphate enzyme [Acidimicrobiales bacterium]